MAAFETAYESLLQGVSQQIPKLRLPGQVTAMENIVADTTTGPRRRPGAQYVFSMNMAGEDATSVKAWDTDIVGQKVHVVIGTRTGVWVVLDDLMTTVLGTGTDPYLVAPSAREIRATTVGSDFYIGNTTVKPVGNPPATAIIPPTRRGFLFVRAGTYGKVYNVTIKTNKGTSSAAYTTPNGVGVGDAAVSTPEYIVGRLQANMTGTSGCRLVVSGSYMYIEGTDDTVTSLAVSSSSGVSYVMTSAASKVRVESDLPALLPDDANDYIMQVGDERSFKYYRYAKGTLEWLECGVYGSIDTITNMPNRLKWDDKAVPPAFVLEKPVYEGRKAGDDDTNQIPEFIERGITGMSTYMNRLVLLSGSKAYMSGSTNPLRFMRSTVTTLLDTDPISVGSSANSSAEYRYAIQFQKDLLLFSEKYQALIPSNGQAITPRNATVVITSAYAGDMGTEPVPIGRTLLFPSPKSQDFYGLMEMVSSQYSEAQYISSDATPHLPKYLPGSCRFGVSSTTSSIVLFGSSGDLKSLVVYEYLWSDDKKVQQAWHTWKFPYQVAYAYFTQGVVNVLMIREGRLVACRVDPRQGLLASNSTRRPYLDMYTEVDVDSRRGQIPEWMRNFDREMKYVLTVATGPMAGQEVGIVELDRDTGWFTTVRSWRDGKVCVGVRYRSMFSPTAPYYADHRGIKVESAKFTVVRYGVNTQNSMEYKVLVTDAVSEDPVQLAQATLYYSSTDLMPGRALYAGESRATIPARTDAGTTVLVLQTEGTGEMNLTGIDYVGRLNEKIRRR